MRLFALLLAAVALAQQVPKTPDRTGRGTQQKPVRTPQVSVGSLTQTPSGNCNLSVGVNTGTLNIKQLNCNDLSPRATRFFREVLQQKDKEKEQAARDLDNMRQRYLELIERQAKLGIRTEADAKFRQLLSEDRIEE